MLAGELVAARGDHAVASPAYDGRMRRLTQVARTGSAGPFLAPASALRIRLRDWTFANPLLVWSLMKLTDMFATDASVPDYDLR